MRHGRTAWNAQGRFQGHTDIALCEVGRAQAAALGRALADVSFDAVFSSDLSRALDTARAIVGDVPLVRDARWREMHFGAWEGLTWAEILQRDPARETSSFVDPAGYAAPHGEAFADVMARVADALEDIRANARGNVLVATHAGALHAALRVLLGDGNPAIGVRIEPASVTTLAMDGDHRQIIKLNDTAHLATTR